MEITIYILIVNLLLFFKLWWDKRAKDSGRVINHALSSAIDSFIFFIAGFFLFGIGTNLGGFFIASLGYRWLMFDLGFNLINGWHWSNCGDSGFIDQKTDLIDGKDDNRCAWTIPIKILIIAVGILIVVYG